MKTLPLVRNPLHRARIDCRTEFVPFEPPRDGQEHVNDFLLELLIRGLPANVGESLEEGRLVDQRVQEPRRTDRDQVIHQFTRHQSHSVMRNSEPVFQTVDAVSESGWLRRLWLHFRVRAEDLVNVAEGLETRSHDRLACAKLDGFVEPVDHCFFLLLGHVLMLRL